MFYLSVFLPAVVSAILLGLKRIKKIDGISYKHKQLIIGIIFGLIGIICTIWGLPRDGYIINCRDASIITASFIFGGPAGLIAGVIAAIYRFLSSNLQAGWFTPLIYAMATMLIAIVSASIKKILFNNRMTSPIVAGIIGALTEVLPVGIFFVNNLKNPLTAVRIVEECIILMPIASGVSVFLAVIFASGATNSTAIRGIFKRDKRYLQPLINVVQKMVLIVIVVAIALSIFAVNVIEEVVENKSTEVDLYNTLDNVEKNIESLANMKMSYSLKKLVKAIESGDYDLKELKNTYNLSEISIAGADGIVYESSNNHNIGFDLASGEQSAEFLELLKDEDTLIQDLMPTTESADIEMKYAGASLFDHKALVQVCYTKGRYQAETKSFIEAFTRNQKIDSEGGLVLFTDEGELVAISSSMPLTDWKSSNLYAVLKYNPNEVINYKPEGRTEIYEMYREIDGYYVIAVIPRDEADLQTDIAYYVTVFVLVLMFALLYINLNIVLKRTVINEIVEMTKGLKKISEGDLDNTIEVRNSLEFASLSDDINKMVDTLKNYIAMEAKRIERELALATNIQLAALPNNFEALKKETGIDLYGMTNPAKEVGGDFYDFYLKDKNYLYFLMADVSGKGIPAAMFMMRSKATIKNKIEQGLDLDKVFYEANNDLTEDNDVMMFVTAWQARLDINTGKVSFADAGHEKAIIKKPDGTTSYYTQDEGVVLGAMEEMEFGIQELTLEHGDILFIYTDGLPEAKNGNEEFYGEERLLNAVRNCNADNPKDLCKEVRADIAAFVGDADQFDDITMLAIFY